MRIFYLTLLNLFIAGLAYAHGVTDADKLHLVSGGNIDYMYLGAKHMLTGYDHLLFLFGVIFFLTKFRDVFKFVTAFTIGHSITLIFATFYEITASYYLIDAVIALSVCYKGFENIDGFKKYLRIKSPNLQAAVLLFGLIHGFGLSTRLQQLPLGDEGLIWKILSFNVGVEVGQTIALSIILVLLMQWRKTESFTKFSMVSNKGLICVGVALFVFQMYGFFSSVESNEIDQFKTTHSVGRVHQHGGGPKHVDPVVEMVEEPVAEPANHGHQHGDHGHAH
ncbi:MAG: hypothetical protein ACI9CF_001949 [Candidatus Omnitrophota bacterium]|jgi:hypothetical protein